MQVIHTTIRCEIFLKIARAFRRVQFERISNVALEKKNTARAHTLKNQK